MFAECLPPRVHQPVHQRVHPPAPPSPDAAAQLPLPEPPPASPYPPPPTPKPSRPWPQPQPVQEEPAPLWLPPKELRGAAPPRHRTEDVSATTSGAWRPPRFHRRPDGRLVGQNGKPLGSASGYPCHPDEWPFDLEAWLPSREAADLIEWFLQRRPQVPAGRLDEGLRLFFQFTPSARVTTVQAVIDPESAELSLLVCRYGPGLNDWAFSHEDHAYSNALAQRPDLSPLALDLLVCTSDGQ